MITPTTCIGGKSHRWCNAEGLRDVGFDSKKVKWCKVCGSLASYHRDLLDSQWKRSMHDGQPIIEIPEHLQEES